MSTRNIDKNQNNNHAITHIPMNEINTTPLVDVLLVLVIIFIITAPIITSNIEVNLPSVKAQPSAEKPESINITVDKEGKVFLDDKEIEIAQISATIGLRDNTKDLELQLKIDEKTEYKKVAEILDQAKKAGVAKLGFVHKVVK